jgi:hypothetical protein
LICKKRRSSAMRSCWRCWTSRASNRKAGKRSPCSIKHNQFLTS